MLKWGVKLNIRRSDQTLFSRFIFYLHDKAKQARGSVGRHLLPSCMTNSCHVLVFDEVDFKFMRSMTAFEFNGDAN